MSRIQSNITLQVKKYEKVAQSQGKTQSTEIDSQIIPVIN